MRAQVMGVSCSGKSTAARKIADKTGAAFIDLDDLFWLPGWQESTLEDFRAKTIKAISAQPHFVIAGNYSKVHDITLGVSDIIIWLNFPFYLVFYRAVTRTFKRLFDQQPVCNGNVENARQVFSKNSIILWVLKSFRARRRKMPPLLKECEGQGKKVLIFTSPRALEAWLERL
jgi:adenylate kinase family enzyme